MKLCIEQVFENFSSCRNNLRNRALLRNFKNLQPIVSNKARLSEKWLILQRFSEIYQPLRAVAESESSTLTMKFTPEFKDMVSKFAGN